jgi:hypothetical protein
MEIAVLVLVTLLGAVVGAVISVEYKRWREGPRDRPATRHAPEPPVLRVPSNRPRGGRVSSRNGTARSSSTDYVGVALKGAAVAGALVGLVSALLALGR